MEFTFKDRKYIDNILARVDEEQKRNGNKLYTFDEVMQEFMAGFELEEENYKV